MCLMAAVESEFFLESHKLSHSLVPPDSLYYVPDFLTITQEQQLIENVVRAPKPRWTYLSNRSLQVYGGYPRPEGMIAEELPGWLRSYTDRLADVFDGHRPNQVLMNRYEPGQGIMAHEDGPLYYPTVATINTGSHTVLNLYRKPTEESSSKRQYCFSLLLWPRSLSVLKRDAYTCYLHEIEELHADQIWEKNRNIINLDLVRELPPYSENNSSLPRATRYSFTIRYVPKCHKINIDRIFGNKKLN